MRRAGAGIGDLVIWRFGDCEPCGQSPNRQSGKSRDGFTLLEMLVATAIMGLAVVGLLSNISTSLQHASRLTEYDRAALVAKRTMDELLVNSRLPYDSPIEGQLRPAETGMSGGWKAVLTRFEEPPQKSPGTPVLDRLELEVWWMSGSRRRAITLDAFRPYVILPPTLE